MFASMLGGLAQSAAGAATAPEPGDVIKSHSEGQTGGGTITIGGGPDPWFYIFAAVVLLLVVKLSK